MRVQVNCPECNSSVFEVTLIDGERLSLKCFMCSARRDVKVSKPKLVVD